MRRAGVMLVVVMLAMIATMTAVRAMTMTSETMQNPISGVQHQTAMTDAKAVLVLVSEPATILADNDTTNATMTDDAANMATTNNDAQNNNRQPADEAAKTAATAKTAMPAEVVRADRTVILADDNTAATVMWAARSATTTISTRSASDVNGNADWGADRTVMMTAANCLRRATGGVSLIEYTVGSAAG